MAKIQKNSNGDLDRASLLLLGFKPLLDAFEAVTNLVLVDKPVFEYPHDYYVKGSKTAFDTLHASMIRKNVMEIGELLLWITAASRIVAITPQSRNIALRIMVKGSIFSVKSIHQDFLSFH